MAESVSVADSEAETKQAALPGLDQGETKEWLLTVTDAGLEYMVLIEAMTWRDARDIFKAEFEMFELGVEDDDHDWDHETVFAPSEDAAKRIVLSREREYMRVYDCSPLGNTATVESVEQASEVDGWRTRRAKRDAEVRSGE